jgi:hypothetical protein
MKKLILFTLSCVLVLVAGVHSAEPVKKTRRGTCFESSHPNYDKVKDYVATYKTLEECRSSGGITPIKTS